MTETILTLWGRYGGAAAALAAGAGMFLAGWQVLSAGVPDLKVGYAPRHGWRSRGAAVKLGIKKDYYPAIAGGVLGFLAFAQSFRTLGVAVVAAFIGQLAGRLAFSGYKWLRRKLDEERKAGETLLVAEVISLYAAEGYTLYDSLTACVYMVDLLRAPLQKALRLWSQGPQRALERLGEEIDLSEARVLTGILQRAVNIGAGGVAELLGQESYAMERIRQYRIEQGLSVRPIIQSLYLIFPGLSLLGISLMPVGYHIAKMIRTIHI